MTTNFREIGKGAQILPSFLRLMCRSTIDYTPDEILEIMRDDAIARLEQFADDNPGYMFPREHLAILKSSDVKMLFEQVKKHHGLSERSFDKCAFQYSEKKTSCFACSVVREIMHEHARTKTPTTGSKSHTGTEKADTGGR